jgi:TonB family protein
MKRCGACDQPFQDRYNFCPVDGAALALSSGPKTFEYRPTIISEETLLRRLTFQIAFRVEQAKVSWPRFRSNPRAFLHGALSELIQVLRLAFARPHLRTGLLAALTIVLCIAGSITMMERRAAKQKDAADSIDPTQVELVNFPTPDTDSQTGAGASEGENGRVGFAKGRGEGSGPTPARAQGGGGGGTQSPLPPSVGKMPLPSEIPAPIPTTYARALPQSLPDAGINLDPVLWKDLPYPNYGDPRAKSTTPSNGPGEGGGIGTSKGTGIGSGERNGVGPGEDGNTGTGKNAPGCCGSGTGSNGSSDDINRIFRQPEVTTRAHVLSKPEPQYTEEARKAGTTGTVVLSVVFSRTGQVTNIRAVQTLCCGLTEKAIAAARAIRFVPAMRNGQVVSTYMQLEYNFNLY